MKKILSSILVIALVLGLFPADFCVRESQAAETTYVFGDYEYTLDEDGAACVVKYSGSAASAAIPSHMDGHTVKSIGDSVFKGHKELISIQIPESVIAIGENAFENSGLKSLVLPPVLETIGEKILSGTDGVTEIKIPKSVRTTKDYWGVWKF